jgi:hypothetical protein
MEQSNSITTSSSDPANGHHNAMNAQVKIRNVDRKGVAKTLVLQHLAT